MPTTLTVNYVRLDARWDLLSADVDAPADAIPSPLPGLIVSFANGSGATGLADQVHYKTYTLAASANVTLDLVAGALLDPFGAVLSFAKVKVFAVWLQPAVQAASITFGNAATPWAPWADVATNTEVIRNGLTGGFMAKVCSDNVGFPAVGGASDKLKFLNNDGALAATFQLLLIGASA